MTKERTGWEARTCAYDGGSGTVRVPCHTLPLVKEAEPTNNEGNRRKSTEIEGNRMKSKEIEWNRGKSNEIERWSSRCVFRGFEYTSTKINRVWRRRMNTSTLYNSMSTSYSSSEYGVMFATRVRRTIRVSNYECGVDGEQRTSESASRYHARGTNSSDSNSGKPILSASVATFASSHIRKSSMAAAAVAIDSASGALILIE